MAAPHRRSATARFRCARLLPPVPPGFLSPVAPLLRERLRTLTLSMAAPRIRPLSRRPASHFTERAQKRASATHAASCPAEGRAPPRPPPLRAPGSQPRFPSEDSTPVACPRPASAGGLGQADSPPPEQTALPSGQPGPPLLSLQQVLPKSHPASPPNPTLRPRIPRMHAPTKPGGSVPLMDPAAASGPAEPPHLARGRAQVLTPLSLPACLKIVTINMDYFYAQK